MKCMFPVGWGQICTLQFCLGTLTVLLENHAPDGSPCLPESVLLGSQLSTLRKKRPLLLNTLHNRDLLL